MKSYEEKKLSLERWKTILLTIGAITTFLTFFVPFINQPEQRKSQAFSETLMRLGDENPAIRAGAAIDLVDFYRYKSLFGMGSSPYREQVIFLLQSSLKKTNEEDFVRQAVIQALKLIGPQTLENSWLKGADLSNLNIRNLSFKGSYLSEAILSGASSQEYKPGDSPVSFEGANLFLADLKGSEFWSANFSNVFFESADLSNSFFLRGTDLRNSSFWRSNLSNTSFYDQQEGANLEGALFDATVLINTDFSNARLGTAVFRNITSWDNRTNFQNADCQGTKFEVESQFYKWGCSRFPKCFK